MKIVRQTYTRSMKFSSNITLYMVVSMAMILHLNFILTLYQSNCFKCKCVLLIHWLRINNPFVNDRHSIRRKHVKLRNIPMCLCYLDYIVALMAGGVRIWVSYNMTFTQNDHNILELKHEEFDVSPLTSLGSVWCRPHWYRLRIHKWSNSTLPYNNRWKSCTIQ